MVTMENAEEYVELMFDLCMHTGIQKQMEAFRGKESCDSLTTLDVNSCRGDRIHQCVDPPALHHLSHLFLRGVQSCLPNGEDELLQPQGGPDDPVWQPITFMDS